MWAFVVLWQHCQFQINPDHHLMMSLQFIQILKMTITVWVLKMDILISEIRINLPKIFLQMTADWFVFKLSKSINSHINVCLITDLIIHSQPYDDFCSILIYLVLLNSHIYFAKCLSNADKMMSNFVCILLISISCKDDQIPLFFLAELDWWLLIDTAKSWWWIFCRLLTIFFQVLLLVESSK